MTGISSIDLKNEHACRTQGDRLLLRLKINGPQTASDLALSLKITGEAVRQQLQKLAADGLIKFQSEKKGVGRPCQRWKLTKLGEGRFSDAHSLITVQLIQGIREALGDGALNIILRFREDEMEMAYRDALADAATLSARIQRLADIRNLEGYMTEWHEEADGTFLFIENHCSIQAAATTCPGFCRSELTLFQRCLRGDNIRIERVEHILSGSRRCAYKIWPSSHNG
ncbi:MAG TPA: metalloregulator ArsR/SmtB family transcription factor [Alloacidobacterium sp.]|nr:metalloregulator ArsR/SmtB family transcription factor [Alloacidobacterium sp.]